MNLQALIPCPTIETRLQPPLPDAGEASGRRRDFRSSSYRLLCLHLDSIAYTSVSVNVSTHANASLRRKLFGVSRSFCFSLYSSGSTGCEISWGIPQPDESLAGYSCRSSLMLVCCYAYLSLNEYSPLVGVEAVYPSGVAPPLSDPSSSPPPPNRSISLKSLRPRRIKESSSFLPPLCLISLYTGQKSELMSRPSADLSYLLTRHCTPSAVLSAFRRGHVPNFLCLGLHIVFGLLDWISGFLAKVGLHITPYLSYPKSLLFIQLPMGSSGLPSSPVAYICLEKQTVSSATSLLRSVSLPNVKWKCPSISITVLLSCVAVRSGPEDATDFISTIFRGADWVLTSPLFVTISQPIDVVVKALSTHLSFVLNSVSSSHVELSCLSAYVIVFYLLNQKGWYIPSFYCN
ncbi:hypothetical protein N665_0383s0167 [Sinapis alba]|nr:hypothetical protein N665_0383s0167 [Sinapis alba]